MSELIKVAAEYDSAGRIMARGFVAEFNKLARSLTEGYGIGSASANDPGRITGPKAITSAPKQEEQLGGRPSSSRRSSGVPSATPRPTLGSVVPKSDLMASISRKMPKLPGQSERKTPSSNTAKTPSSNVTIGKAIRVGSGNMSESGRKALRGG